MAAHNNETASQAPVSIQATPKPSLLRRLLNSTWKAVTAVGLLSAVVAFFVNEYGPGVVDNLRQDDPVRVIAHYDSNYYDDGWSMALPSSVSPSAASSEPLGSVDDVRRWAESHGGADIGQSYIRMTVQGRRNSTVIITNMRAVVTRRTQPFDGVSVSTPSGSDVAVRAVSFDLDHAEPIARRPVDEDGTLGGSYFGESIITLEEGEVEVFSITGATKNCYCEWVIQLELLVDGEEQRLAADNNGEPFRTTARIADGYEAYFEWPIGEEAPGLIRVEYEEDETDSTPVPGSPPSSAPQTSAPATPPPATSQPASPTPAPPPVTQPAAGLLCRDLYASGLTYSQAVNYWYSEGSPDRMDEDLNGIPCETVYPTADVTAHWGDD